MSYLLKTCYDTKQFIKEEPVVSVVCLTYNHGKYVKDMLDGLLSQETNFSVEFIIHDDASTDETVQILMEYQKKYPGVFHVIYEKENQWSKGIKITQKIVMPLVRGKYVAFCEGDDFWIDNHKLQEQVDFLENHPDYACVAHNSLRYDCENGSLKAQNQFNCSKTIEEKYIIDRRFPFLATASKVYRKEAFLLDGFFLECGEVGDLPTEYYALTKGKFYYIDKIMSVYRYMSKGSWSSRMQCDMKANMKFRVQYLEFLYKYNNFTEKKYEFYICVFMSRSCHIIVDILTNNNISKDTFQKIKQEVDIETKHKFRKWSDEIQRISNILVYGYDTKLSQYLKEISKTKSLYIFGAGVYGHKMKEFFDKNEIPMCGFVVTHREIGHSPEETVLEIEEYSVRKEDSLLVVGITSAYWEEVLKEFQQYEIDEYVYPIFCDCNCV